MWKLYKVRELLSAKLYRGRKYMFSLYFTGLGMSWTV